MSIVKRSLVFAAGIAVFLYLFFWLQWIGMTPPDYDYSLPNDQIVEAMDRHGALSDLLVKSEIFVLVLLIYGLSHLSRDIKGLKHVLLSIAPVLVGVALARSAMGLPSFDVRLITSCVIAFASWGIPWIVNTRDARRN
ncbi:hypothetical protein [Pararhodobacter sp.]|uniref:hypothetical protein n=1 Tax=Pararhodobacter sp. TaxID=2127056 RepID=UPI002FE10232